MRARSATQTILLAKADSVRHRRVKVANSAGTLVDFTTLEGYDWVRTVEWGLEVDQPHTQLTVTFLRSIEKLSLAPLHTTSKLNQLAGSYSPALAEGRLIVVEDSITAPGETPSVWEESFRGEIDDVNSEAGPNTIRVTAFDLGHRLVDTFIEDDSRDYGSTLGVAVETVMQSILTDNGTGVTLWCPVSPGFVISPAYRQKQESVWSALEGLMKLFGGQLRYVYDTATSAWRLKLTVPERTSPSVVYTWYPNTKDSSDVERPFYIEASELQTSRRDVRNRIRVRGFDRTNLDAAGNPTPINQVVEDLNSIGKFGGAAPQVKRYMEIRLEDTDPLSTNAALTTLANNILSDLKDPLAQWVMEVPYFGAAELGDYYVVKANNEHFTADQSLAVVGIRHVFPERGSARTTLTLRGKPVTWSRRWIEIGTQLPENEGNVATGPSAPTSLAAEPVVGGSQVTWQKPVAGGQDVADYEVHVSDTSGFTPAAGTHLGTTAGTSFSIDNVPIGATRYVKVVPRDEKGNRGTASAQLAVTAGELPQDMGQYDGITIRQIAKGHYAGTAKNESAITFPQAYQNAPVVLVGHGGLVDQTGALWGTTWDDFNQRYGTSARPAGNIYNEAYAYDVTAATCRIRARLRSKSGSILRTANADTADNNLTAVGQSAAATLHTAPSGAVGDAYTLRYKVAVEVQDPSNTGDPGPPIIQPYIISASVVIAIESSIDGGTNWVERATYTYTASARDVIASGSWPDEQKTVNVAGLTSGAPADKLRIKIKSFTSTGGVGTVSAHLYSTAATVPDSGPGLSYYTAADVYANKTPEADDVVTFDIFEVN